jgi:hypothetical protein
LFDNEIELLTTEKSKIGITVPGGYTFFFGVLELLAVINIY